QRATNKTSAVLVASGGELRRVAQHRADPEARFHYRYQAAFLALDAARLLPDNSDETARILCTAGSWLKNRDPQTADLFYKALVRRCRKTALGGELVDLFGGDFPAVAAPAANAAVTVGRLESEPALFAIGSPLRDVVLRLPFLRLCWRAGDDTGEPAVPGFLQRGRNLVGAQAAEAAKGEAQLFVRISSASFRSYHAGNRSTCSDPGNTQRRIAQKLTA